MNNPTPRWLTKPEAAQLLGVHPNTIDNLRKRKRPGSSLPVLRSRRQPVARGVGSPRVFINRQDVMDLKSALDEITADADALTDNGQNDPAEA